LCSIAGILENCVSDSGNAIQRANYALGHRGPDAHTFYRDDDILLAHNRLAILDLSEAGAQPMTSKNGRFVICYNGEVYNHIVMRDKKIGFSWRGHSDTETLLELLADCICSLQDLGKLLNQFNGMFAFALWDKQEKDLYLVRDRFGVKPLFLYGSDCPTAFASEIKAFKAAGLTLTKRPEALHEYMTYGHTLNGTTFYNEIHQLAPGTFMKVKVREGCQTLLTYWNIPQPTLFSGSYAEAVNELERLISDSIKIRLISDVPYGVFLSGGIDSSLITAIMQLNHNSPIKTFSVGFESAGKVRGHEYDELSAAAMVAKHIGTEHHEVIIRPQDIVDNLEAMVASYDQPFADPAAFPTWFLSRFTSKSVKVVLTGEGADELFGGYRRYRAHLWSQRHNILARCFGGLLGLAVRPFPAFRKAERLSRSFSA